MDASVFVSSYQGVPLVEEFVAVKLVTIEPVVEEDNDVLPEENNVVLEDDCGVIGMIELKGKLF